jgi:NitT/TauT family transport system ATP-binding protein
MERALLELDRVGLTWPNGTTTLDGIDLSVQRGSITAVVGASGCGKSTLLRLAAGLLQPTAGAVRLGGEEPRRARAQGHSIGMVFQDATLLAWRSLLDNVALPLELARVPKPSRRKRAQIELERVGLAAVSGLRPHQLSGGMKMRVAIARALVAEPSLLLLDEPFGALDEITRQRLDEELLRLVAERGCAAMLITHSVAEAVFVADRVVVMAPRAGPLIADMPITFDHPRTPALRATPAFAARCGDIATALAEGA